MKLTHAFVAALSVAFLSYAGRAADEKNVPAAKESSSAPGSSASLPAEAPLASPASPSDPVIETPAELVIPAGRPAWVEALPKVTGDVQQYAVSSEPWHSKTEARRNLDEALVAQTNEYITEHLASSLATKFPSLSYDAKTIRQRFVKPENIYDETIISPSVGPMHQLHALLEFGPSFRDELDEKWAEVRATSRLFQAGLFSGAGLLLLASVFGYFRLDNATRGYYTGRLQFLTAAAILAVVGAGAVLARWITWM